MQARTELNYGQLRTFLCGKKGLVPLVLSVCPFAQPPVVTKHQDVRSGDVCAAATALRHRGGTHRGLVHLYLVEVFSGVDLPALRQTTVGALHEVDRPVTLDDAVLLEPLTLELTIHIACKDEERGFVALSRPLLGPPDVEQYPKAVMGRRLGVEAIPVSEESPCERWVLIEPLGIGHVLQMQTQRPERRIGTPKAFRPTEIRQT
mmetsp:Transcript_9514/g.23283  ORF Transcript_9514/g.23283 Transcript_9514/m.23283 type:complete len:205 (-) Transcript_9514:199-813(-)